MPSLWRACGDQRRRTGSGRALEALGDDALYKYMFTLLCLLGCMGVVVWG